MSDTLVSLLKQDSKFMAGVTRWETVPDSPGSFDDFPAGIEPDLKKIYNSRNITRLYSHQTEAFKSISAGRHTTIVTPTASGKTLCYNLPVIDYLLKNNQSRAMYLFPTKALSQDQQSELNEVLLSGKLPLKAATYDGDTPASLRMSAREQGRVIITNPDMLHSGILPNHPKWIKFFSCLRFIVIDEVHIYRGIFGSHVTNVIRRLKRICRFYGSDPIFICCSATIGNPKQHSEHIIEEKIHLIDTNGAPRGKKHFILYNPPLLDRVQGIRRGVVLEAQELACRLLKKKIKTIVFARSRIRTELIAAYINSSLKNFFNDNNSIDVQSYRGGYLPSERRSIEKGLRDGSIQGVVSTNALELGIDIGGLDAVIMAGFPGSISSSWQQAGRSGRRNSDSISILIASAAPTDQFMIRHPDYFFGKNPENAMIDADNIFILSDHVKCAAFELPFNQNEKFGSESTEILDYLVSEGVLRNTGGKYFWSDRSYPAESISLRSATAENIVIIDITGGNHTVIGEMDRPSAKELIYKDAVYIHRGEQYIVRELDIDEKRCFVEQSNVNFYTDAVVKTDLKVLTEDSQETCNGIGTVTGDVLVRTQAAKFKKIKYRSHENIGYGEITLPEEEMHTRSIVLLFDKKTAAGRALESVPHLSREHILAALGVLVKNVAPVFLLCDPSDIGISERIRDPHFNVPVLYCFDRYPGGSGISEGFSREIKHIIHGAYDLVSQCSCNAGCPSCIGPVEPDNMNSKEEMIKFFQTWFVENG
ncbi:MAG: DEAD/DEAH box helicase [Spirochaetales bacterium]|nr:DEAD/DEAH box helicase [Spirochaetales bacterium]